MTKKYWELTILKNELFLSRPFWIFFFRKKKKISFIPMKTSQSLMVSKDGSKCLWLPWFSAVFYPGQTFLSRVYTDLFLSSWRKRKWLLTSTNASPSTRWITLSLQWKNDATKSYCVQVRSSVSCGISYHFCAIRFHIHFGCEFKRIRKKTLFFGPQECSVKLAVKNKKNKVRWKII